MSVRYGASLLLLIVLSMAGCTAVIARSRVAAAGEALLLAGRAGAERSSPYEFTKARLSLEKAREEEDRGRYGPAADLAAEAERLAVEARENALGEAGAPASVTP